MHTYILPEGLRKKLKKPFGISILGKKKEVVEKFRQLLAEKKFKKIITVGDYCSLTLPSDIKIFDGKIKRKKIAPPQKFFSGALKCSNPKGTIQTDCWQTIKSALKENKNVFAEGEEDLLAIPAVLLAPKKAAIVYGLPNQGICVIEISDKAKKIFRELLKKFN